MSGNSNVAHYEDPVVVARYNDLRDEGLFTREARAVDRYFDPGSRVLDVGCGAGRTSNALDERGYDVVGVDASVEMIAAARAAHDGARYLVGDATRLPFTDASFDNAIFSYNGLDELRPANARTDALCEIRRVLAPGGRFVFSTHNLLRELIPYPVTFDHLRDFLGFWVRNARAGQLWSPYKEPRDGDDGVSVYHVDPIRQARQLDAAGFDFHTLLEREGVLSKYLGPSLFFVVEKPPAAASRTAPDSASGAR